MSSRMVPTSFPQWPSRPLWGLLFKKANHLPGFSMKTGSYRATCKEVTEYPQMQLVICICASLHVIAARAPWAQLPNLPVWQEKSRCESGVTWWIYAQVANGKWSTACSLLLQNWRMRTIVWVAMFSKIIRSVWLHFCAGSWEWKFLYRLGKILFAVWIYWFQMDYTHMKLVNLLLEHN